MISSSIVPIDIKYNKITSVYHLTVTNLKSSLGITECGFITYFDFIVIFLIIFNIVTKFCSGVGENPNQSTVVISKNAFFMPYGRGDYLVEIAVAPNQEFNKFFFQKQCMN